MTHSISSWSLVALMAAGSGCSDSSTETADPGEDAGVTAAHADPEGATGGSGAEDNGGATHSGGTETDPPGPGATGGASDAGTGGVADASSGGEANAATGGSVNNTGSGGSVSTLPSNCEGTYDLPTCVSDMADNGGGTVVLAEKTYLLTERLILRNNVNIVGQGPSSLITWDESVAGTIDAAPLFSSNVDDITLEHFAIECSIDQDPDSSDLRNEQIGLYLYCGGDPTIGEDTGCNNVSLNSIEVSHCAHGVHLKGVTGVTAIDLNLHHNGNTEVDFFHNIYFRRVADLIVKQTTPTSGGYWASPRGHGIRGSHLSNVYFEGLSVYDNADHGVHVDLVYNMRMHNMDVHDNCANPSGACAAVKCYGDQCDLNADAPKEP